ncbi:hypothetical protein KO500_03945 [Cellulophaga baltica]|uniref:hypothetical protein n=1 Tax=Cellulophaga TaxID=104264 RepID=UPI001C068FDC|nr:MULTISPECIES: hypothetical protein [Cellulophaga]MBU2995566.1 hypothetical protein [Cellulophaga baltica]MDO6766960.1 hypothetical protein [Cellulophaga sp. 1_MG-2023]
MNLNRSQLSLLITFFSMSIVVLVLYNIHLGSEKEKEEYTVELAMMEEIPEELIEEEVEQEQSKSESVKSHQAYNETAKASYGNPEPLKTLEELMEESELSSDTDEQSELLTSDASSGNYAASLKELREKRRKKKELLGEREAQKDVPTNNLAKRRTSISYSLVERSHRKLPVPIYTCIEGGKIVINIEVDNNGTVIEADYNKKSSTTENGCLIDNAIAYAKKARFNSTSKASQKGTITYLFQEKAR